MQYLAGHLRLLVDLFDHKVGKTAFLHRAHFLGHQFRLALDQAAILDGVQLHTVVPQRDDLTIVEADHLARERQNGGQVRGDTGKPIADAHHQPGTFFDGIQFVIVDAPDDKSVIAQQVVIGQADGFDEILAFVDVTFYRMHTGFAIVL